MNANWWVLIGQLAVVGGVIFTAWWGQRNARKQPAVDSATAEHTDVDSDRLRQVVEQLNEQSNARRDIRLAQFHGFLLLDSEWHLIVMANERKLINIVRELIAMVEALKGDVSHIVVPEPSPPPPVVPPPPPVPA